MGYAECTRTLIVHARAAREIPLALGLKPEHINTSIKRNRRCECGQVIVRRCLIRDPFATANTLMDDHPPLFSTLVQLDRSHGGLACRFTVAGSFPVHVHAVQTVRTVVSITSVLQGFHMLAAVDTYKGFLTGDEGHRSSSESASSYIERFASNGLPCSYMSRK